MLNKKMNQLGNKINYNCNYLAIIFFLRYLVLILASRQSIVLILSLDQIIQNHIIFSRILYFRNFM